MDDIDRLDRIEIQALFKLIRLSADFPYVIYILAFDDEIVAAALGEAYETGDSAAGRRFLEKIIQVPLHLPRANSQALRKMAFEAVESILKSNKAAISEADSYAFANNFALSFESQMITPRQVKLYENALTFAVPILAGETNIVDLLLIEAVRTFLPKLYLAIRDNSELFLKGHQSQKDKEEQLNGLLADVFDRMELPAGDQAAVRSYTLERLFPRISKMGYGEEWDEVWGREKHICSADYFPRYFSYGVPIGDISDQFIEGFVTAGMQGDLNTLSQNLHAVKDRGAYPIFIRKLRKRENSIPEAAAASLVQAISTHAIDFPREPSSMFSDWTIMQSAILTSHLAQKFAGDDARYSIIRNAIKSSLSPIYSADVFRWTRKYEEKGEVHGFLSEEKIGELTQVMIANLLKSANGMPLYRFLNEDTPKVLLCWSWYGDQSALHKNIEASITAEGPDGAEALIQACCGKSWEMQTGIPHVSDVRRSVYDTIARFADPDFVMQTLKKRYGEKLDTPTFRPDRDTPVGERVALQFAYIYKQPKSEQKEEE